MNEANGRPLQNESAQRKMAMWLWIIVLSTGVVLLFIGILFASIHMTTLIVARQKLDRGCLCASSAPSSFPQFPPQLWRKGPDKGQDDFDIRSHRSRSVARGRA
jgi:hypothetical protein